MWTRLKAKFRASAKMVLIFLINQAWVNFIKNGDPGWNKYDPQKRNVMVITAESWEEKEDLWFNERQLIKLP